MVYAQRWFLLTTWMTEQQNPLWCLHTDDTLLEQKWSDCGIFWIDDKLGKRTAMRWDIHYEFTSEIPRQAWWSSSSKLPSASIWARRILMHLQKPVSDCRASLSRVARINHSILRVRWGRKEKKTLKRKKKTPQKLASQSDLCDISLFMSTETCWQADISNRLEQLAYHIYDPQSTASPVDISPILVSHQNIRRDAETVQTSRASSTPLISQCDCLKPLLAELGMAWKCDCGNWPNITLVLWIEIICLHQLNLHDFLWALTRMLQ